MRKIIGVLMLVAVYGTAGSAPINQNDISDCKVFGELARTIMDLRQMGAKMSDLLEPDEDGADLTNSLIIDAFSTPQYQTEDAKKKAVRDFENQIFLDCTKQRRSTD